MLSCLTLLILCSLALHLAQGAIGLEYLPTRQQILLSHASQLPQQGTVVLLGDSLLDGLLLPAHGGYWLNAGMGSCMTHHILPMLRRIVEFTMPKAILVAVGVNDTMRGDARFDPDASRGMHIAMCKFIRSLPSAADHNAKDVEVVPVHLVLSSLLPVAKGMPLGDIYFDPARIRLLNSIIHAVAIEENADFLDSFAHLADSAENLPDCLTVDGVHLNTGGYEIWKDLLRQHLRYYWP